MDKGCRARRVVGTAAMGLGMRAEPAHAQWARVLEQFFMPASHNWVFRRNYPGADRLFNAFDYGHAILYEKLLTRPGAPASELDVKEFDYITRKLLVAPPRLPVEEAAIEVEYAKLAPEAKMMFEWAHILHRQIYDILGDERLSQAEKDREVAAVMRYYKSRPDLAFSSLPKSMELMEGQYYATAFREAYPKFNGLIWGYHWLQVGLYEPLMTGRSPEARQAGVTATVARFRQMLENAPEHMPRVMPMTAAIAPTFAARYPEAAIVFDNLHGMHDVISDILASPRVPRARKREEILRAAAHYRDDTSFLMTVQEWREMGTMMGIQNMGGPAVGFLPAFPEPTLPRGAVMAHTGMNHGAAGQTSHAAHGDAQPAAGQAQSMEHSAMPGMQPAQSAPASANTQMTDLHEHMMADPVIRQRVEADSALQRMVQQTHGPTSRGATEGAASDSAQAIDFAVRLLSDPQVQARVHSDPRLHRLWSDPEVQRRLAELRRQQGTRPAPATPEHKH
ncbi:MAG TPA: hypothetical protein VF710_22230 [Longimicrobium sp.]